MNKTEVYQALTDERNYQDGKWGTIVDRPHTVGEWLLIVEGELAEAKEAWIKCAGDHNALLEIMQVGAVVVACLEQHGVQVPEGRYWHRRGFVDPK
jgi:hypothetical protein